MNFPKSKDLLDRNAVFIPGGLASLNRNCDPCIAFKKARGAQMWDLDGNQYLDYHAGFAPYILGHSDPDLAEAIVSALRAGKSNCGSGPTEDEGHLAKLFLQCVPFAEKVQFFNTGSEATAQAIRVARACTGKPHVLMMQGGYNGNHNMVAANLMSTRDRLGGRRIEGDEYPLVPITAGIPEVEQELMHAVEFNDLSAVETVARKYDLAALITEPVLQNIGVVKPKADYLVGLRGLADRYGFLLIFDEVKTGFRASLGGYQAIANVTPDLSTFGKAFANGFPIAALAGKQQFMDLAISPNPAKRVLVGGTYNCHPVPVAAATACLKKLMDPDLDVYGTLERLAQRLEKGQRKLFNKHNVKAVISRVGSAHCVYFAARVPECWWDVLELHNFKFDLDYRRALLERGVYYFPVACKQGSISFAHTEEDIDFTLAAMDDTLFTLARREA